MATTPRLTSPDKVVYPDAEITKGEVADYYRAVSRWMLPELVRRPLSLVRCPDGISGSCFFQKHHADSLGEHVGEITLREVSGQGDYLFVENLDGVLELVQMNSLEFHVWGSRIDDVEKPDRLVFDLDPDEGIEWNALKAAAREVRDRLAELGLRSWVRLSGGKGVHVVAPIRPGPDWAQVKAFCEGVADSLVSRAPDRYIATASKAKREGLIFIDWLRNSRGATSVTSWSLRARPGATVAMPLTWEELGRVRRAGAFDLPKALRRARNLKRDPWHAMHRARQSLPG